VARGNGKNPLELAARNGAGAACGDTEDNRPQGAESAAVTGRRTVRREPGKRR